MVVKYTEDGAAETPEQQKAREQIAKLIDAGILFGGADVAHVSEEGGAAYAAPRWEGQPIDLADFLRGVGKDQLAEMLELKAEKELLLGELNTAYRQANDPDAKTQLQQLIDRVTTASTPDAIRAVLASARGEMAAAISNAASNSDEMAKAEMHRLNAIMDNADSRLRELGYGDQDYEKHLKRLQQELAMLHDGSDEWRAKQHEIALYRKEHFEKIEKQATADGNHEAAELARKAAKAAAQSMDRVASQAQASKVTTATSIGEKESPAQSKARTDEEQKLSGNTAGELGKHGIIQTDEKATNAGLPDKVASASTETRGLY